MLKKLEISILILIIVGTGFFVSYAWNMEPVSVETSIDQTDKSYTARPISAETKPESASLYAAPFPELTAPELPNGYEWAGSPAQEGQFRIYSHTGAISMSATLQGTKWEYEVPKLYDDSYSFDKNPLTLYEKAIETDGWSKYVIDSTAGKIDGYSADGRIGSWWSYLRIDNGILKMVTLHYSFYPQAEDADGMPSCPCKASYLIFMSEPVAVEEIAWEKMGEYR